MKIKQCSKCKQYKPLRNFSRDNSKKTGLRSQCKVCYQEYATSQHGRMARHQANKRYFATEKGKQTKQRCNIRRRNGSNRKAHYLTRLEIRTRRLSHPTQLKCKKCDGQATEYHHENYDEPLNITPLCQKCHIEIHGGIMV